MESDGVMAALARIPAFAGVASEKVIWTRLGGLTNLVYRVEAGGRSYAKYKWYIWSWCQMGNVPELHNQ